jgi:hypothetical protein
VAAAIVRQDSLSHLSVKIVWRQVIQSRDYDGLTHGIHLKNPKNFTKAQDMAWVLSEPICAIRGFHVNTL